MYGAGVVDELRAGPGSARRLLGVAELPLTDNAAKGLDAVFDFILKILKCADQVPKDDRSGAWKPEDANELKRIAEALKKLRAEGKIDQGEKSSTEIGAYTDSDGIHVNENYGDGEFWEAFPEELHLDDCLEGAFESTWTAVQFLLHEFYHWEHDVGVLGSLGKAAVDLLMFPTLFGGWLASGKPPKSPWVHEWPAFNETRRLLLALGYMLSDICRAKPRCIPCCAVHLSHCQGAARKQEFFD